MAEQVALNRVAADSFAEFAFGAQAKSEFVQCLYGMQQMLAVFDQAVAVISSSRQPGGKPEDCRA